jgi:hypothetical protein
VKDFQLGFPVPMQPNGEQPEVENQKQTNNIGRIPHAVFLHDPLALEEN